MYAAGEKKNSKFSQINFAKSISKMSKTQVIILKKMRSWKDILRRIYLKMKLIGMGAGLISKWMRELKAIFMNSKQELVNKFVKIFNNTSLSTIAGLILEVEFFFKPENKNQLIEFLKKNKKKDKFKIKVIGAGSNILIRDNGVKGVVIKLGPSFSKINLIDKTIIEAGAGTLDRKISTFAKENEIGGMEFLSCIPGSIGGAVV